MSGWDGAYWILCGALIGWGIGMLALHFLLYLPITVWIGSLGLGLLLAGWRIYRDNR